MDLNDDDEDDDDNDNDDDSLEGSLQRTLVTLDYLEIVFPEVEFSASFCCSK